ncbi:peptidylprolyl isomerase [Candidatus Woesearchaeota archaeon]|nr:peptidylprolyl isomerase [Candidatus Woesearchaeota archaeon]
MLQAIRERAQGIVAWVMLIMIGVPFALWGIQNYFDSGQEQPVATVGKRDIFERDVNRIHEQNLASLVGLDDQIDEQQLKREALEKLVREEVLVQVADQKKMVVSDEDVKAFIQTLPYFQTEGKFDKEKYRIMLSSQGMTPEAFVPQVRKALILEQFQRGVMDSAFVTRGETTALIRLRNLEREVEYVTVPPVNAPATYSDAALEASLKQHAAEFQRPEQVSVEYIAVSLPELAKAVPVSDEALRKLYEEQKALYTTDERRRVSHLLITAEGDTPEQETAAQAKAQSLKTRLAQGEDFAKLAREYSGDSASAQKGGDLGILTKGAMDEKFSDAAFALQEGQVSDPVKTSFGYHLIKVVHIEPTQVQAFDTVKNELVNTFQRNAAENLFYEQGQKLTQLAFEHPDSLEQAATSLNLKIQEIPLFTRDAGTGLAEREEIRKAAFGGEVLSGRNSEPVELDNELAVVLRVKSHEPARDRSLAEARTDLIKKLHEENTRKLTLDKARAIMAGVEAGKLLTDLSKAEKGVTYKKAAGMKRDTVEYPPVLVDAIFNTPVDANGKAALKNVELEDGSQAIFQILSQKVAASSTDTARQEESAHNLLTKSQGQREMTAWVARLRETFNVVIRDIPKAQSGD